MHLFRLCFAAAALLACQRSESAPGGAPSTAADAAPSSQTDASLAPPSAPEPVDTAVASPSCVIPLAEPPPPPAEPAANCPADPLATPPELGRGNVTFSEAPGAPSIGVEIADSDAERSRGLMYRTSLPEEQGMIFSWSDERVRSFWMRNTCIPLDMLFLDKNGFILGVLEQVPVMNEAARSIPCPAAHVLEVNAGYCRSHGVKPGMRVKLE